MIALLVELSAIVVEWCILTGKATVQKSASSLQWISEEESVRVRQLNVHFAVAYN